MTIGHVRPFIMFIQFAPAFYFGTIPCGIIPYVATIPCIALFSYLEIVFASLHLVFFRQPCLTHVKFDFGFFYCYEFNTSFSSHPPFGFSLEKIFLPSNYEKVVWCNKFLMIPFCNYFYWEIKMTFASYETLDFES
jgi:hypothetical protein